MAMRRGSNCTPTPAQDNAHHSLPTLHRAPRSNGSLCLFPLDASKSGAQSSAATSLDQLLQNLADTFRDCQDKLAGVFDGLASGYQQYEAKFPKTRPHIPFSQWTTSKLIPLFPFMLLRQSSVLIGTASQRQNKPVASNL